MSTSPIWLIDDDASIRDSLSFLLQTLGWQVTTYSSVAAFEANSSVTPTLTGCLLMDIRMPGKSGLSWLEETSQHYPLVPVILMTGHGTIDLCRRAFQHGAWEFFTKPLDSDKLIDCISEALVESEQRAAQQQERQLLENKFAQLTLREREVLELLVEGQSAKEIARALSLSPRTAEAHRASIFARLEVSSLAPLVWEYARLKMLSQPGKSTRSNG
ncbi:response regulator transcription factor [Erwinia aphidicola]|uniref:response regulator transcription factor n=1 Tax=Erwinia aphidicola TaxID=68334 RepID=UPI00301AFF9A